MSRFSCAEYILVDIETNDLEFILICTNLGKFRITTILFSAILHLAPEHIVAYIGALLLGYGPAGQSHLGSLAMTGDDLHSFIH